MPSPIQSVPLRTVLFDGTTPESKDLIKSLGSINRTWATFFATGADAVSQGKHAERMKLDPGGVPDAGLYVETDRAALYQARVVAKSPAWVFVTGEMQGTLAQRPADLGSDDAGFRFSATDAQDYRWNGSAWIATGMAPDAAIAAPVISTSNTAATAGATYTPTERGMLNDLKAGLAAANTDIAHLQATVNSLRATLTAHGLTL